MTAFLERAGSRRGILGISAAVCVGAVIGVLDDMTWYLFPHVTAFGLDSFASKYLLSTIAAIVCIGVLAITLFVTDSMVVRLLVAIVSVGSVFYLLLRVVQESIASRDILWGTGLTRSDPLAGTGWMGAGGVERRSPPVPSMASSKHGRKPGRVTVSGNSGDDMPKGTLASVKRQAGLRGI